MKAFAILMSGLLLATPVAAQNSGEGAARSATTAEEQADNPSSNAENGAERQICRRVETTTGSRLGARRLCLTQREWQAYRRQN